MADPAPPVVVVGAGPVGLAAAVLRRRPAGSPVPSSATDHLTWNSTSSTSSPRSCSIENSARAGTRNRSPAIWIRNDEPVSRASASRRSFATTSSVW